MKAFLIIFGGSGIGGFCRYLVQDFVYKQKPTVFPLGTFIVNIIGCFIIGILAGFVEKENVLSTEWRLALITGFCGGFTTFSSFGLENMNLLRNGNYLYFGLYTLLSIVVGFAAVFAGNYLAK